MASEKNAITAKRIVLADCPSGEPKPNDFRLEVFPIPQCPAGGLLLCGLYLSLDPYMRGRMDDRKSYSKPMGIGEVMAGETVSEVIQADHPVYSVGDIVLARTGWATHRTSDGIGLRKLDPALAPVTTGLGVLDQRADWTAGCGPRQRSPPDEAFLSGSGRRSW